MVTSLAPLPTGAQDVGVIHNRDADANADTDPDMNTAAQVVDA